MSDGGALDHERSGDRDFRRPVCGSCPSCAHPERQWSGVRCGWTERLAVVGRDWPAAYRAGESVGEQLREETLREAHGRVPERGAFEGGRDARAMGAAWRRESNENRLHSLPGYVTLGGIRARIAESSPYGLRSRHPTSAGTESRGRFRPSVRPGSRRRCRRTRSGCRRQLIREQPASPDFRQCRSSRSAIFVVTHSTEHRLAEWGEATGIWMVVHTITASAGGEGSLPDTGAPCLLSNRPPSPRPPRKSWWSHSVEAPLHTRTVGEIT